MGMEWKVSSEANRSAKSSTKVEYSQWNTLGRPWVCCYILDIFQALFVETVIIKITSHALVQPLSIGEFPRFIGICLVIVCDIDLISCVVKPLVVRLMCLIMYWLHTTVIQQDRSRGKMIP